MKRRQPRPTPVIPDKAKAFFSDPWDWENFTNGTWDEYLCCSFMRKNVITPSEKDSMATMNLTLEDMVNGRYGDREEQEVWRLFTTWNARLGYELYRR